jgi:hypothetical protein
MILNVLNHMSEWFRAHQLILNPTKPKGLKFTSAEPPNALNLINVARSGNH